MNYRPDFFRHPAQPFTMAVMKAAGLHAAASRKEETCGLVRAGVYVPCRNVAENPATEFEIDPQELAIAYAEGDLEGIVHSHPGGPWHPSKADMLGQLETGVPWAIVVPGETGAETACHWGGVRPPVFENGQHVPRAFLHGVSDCYSLVQDYYRETHGLEMPDHAREWEWWRDLETHGEMYLDNFRSAGFKVISTDPQEYSRIAQPGDAYLMSIRSRTPNHAGVYLGEGLLLEHMHGKLSCRAPISRLMRHITHWLRMDLAANQIQSNQVKTGQ